MRDKRTTIGRFIHSTWTNLNIRCANGIYRNLRTVRKCLCYDGVLILFSRDEFKNWCHLNKNLIETLDHPSIDRIDNNKNYTLENIQISDLSHNIRKDKTVFIGGYGVCSLCKEKKVEDDFCVDKRRFVGRGTICKMCDSKRKKW